MVSKTNIKYYGFLYKCINYVLILFIDFEGSLFGYTIHFIGQ